MPTLHGLGLRRFRVALVAGKRFDTYRNFTSSYYLAAVLLELAAVVVLMLRPPKAHHEPAA